MEGRQSEVLLVLCDVLVTRQSQRCHQPAWSSPTSAPLEQTWSVVFFCDIRSPHSWVGRGLCWFWMRMGLAQLGYVWGTEAEVEGWWGEKGWANAPERRNGQCGMGRELASCSAQRRSGELSGTWGKPLVKGWTAYFKKSEGAPFPEWLLSRKKDRIEGSRGKQSWKSETRWCYHGVHACVWWWCWLHKPYLQSVVSEMDLCHDVIPLNLVVRDPTPGNLYYCNQ